MNIAPFEANVISSAIDYFVKQDIKGVSVQQKEKLNASAIEAKAIIASKNKEIGIEHIQAMYAALEMYIENMKKSVLANPNALATAEELAERFYAFLEPLS